MKAKDFCHMKELLMGFALIGFIAGGLTGYNPDEPGKSVMLAVLGLISGIITVEIIYLPTRFFLKYALPWAAALAAGIYFFQSLGALIVNLLMAAALYKYLVKSFKLWSQAFRKQKDAGKPADNPAH